MQHHSSRRRSYGSRNHELRERIRRRLNTFAEEYERPYAERDRDDDRAATGAAIFRAVHGHGRSDA